MCRLALWIDGRDLRMSVGVGSVEVAVGIVAAVDRMRLLDSAVLKQVWIGNCTV